MKKVLCSLVVLAILVGMFVCLGVQAFAEDQPKDLAIVAVAYDQLSAEQIDRIKQDKQDLDVLIVDINGVDNDGAGYSYVYSDMDPGFEPDNYKFIWPGMSAVPSFEVTNADQTSKCTVVLLPVGADDTMESIDAVVANYKLEGQVSVVIAVAPDGANVQAAVDSDVDKVLVCSDSGISSDKLIKVGGEESKPVSLLVVDEAAGIQAENMPLPEAGDPAVGAMEPQVDETGAGPAAQPSYTITFNPNGGTGDVVTVTVGEEQGYSFQLPENTFTAPEGGREFQSWQNVDDFTDHLPGETISDVSADMTFQAIWSEPVAEPAPAPVTFTVTFVPGDGATGTPYEVSDVTADTPLGMIEMPSDFAKDGCTFTGWLLGGVHYDVYEPYYVSEETTITAEWTANEVAPQPVIYTVTYDLNGGANVDESVNPLQEQKDFTDIPAENRYMGVPSASWVTPPEGKQFAGWLCSLDEKTYLPSIDDPMAAQVLLTGDVTFTAQWQDVTAQAPGPQEAPPMSMSYSVTYLDGSGATYEAPEYEGNASFALATPEGCGFTVPQGMAFNGWLCDMDGNVYGANETFLMLDSNVTFTAQWKAAAESYTVTYSANGGVGDDVIVPEQLKDSTITLQASGFTAPQGQKFSGWTVQGTDGSVKYPAGSEYVVTGDVTFLAVWEPLTGQDAGATTTDMLTYTQGGNAGPMLSFVNAKIATVAFDTTILTKDSQYVLTDDDKTLTLDKGFLDGQSAGTHVLTVTFQAGPNGESYGEQIRNVQISAAEKPAEDHSDEIMIVSAWDRSGNWEHTFDVAPASGTFEIYYGKDTNGNEVYQAASQGTDYDISGNTLTLYPEMLNGNGTAVWPNGSYRFQVDLADGKTPTMQLTVSGEVPQAPASNQTTDSNANTQGGAPVTGDDFPLVMMIVITVVLVVALAVVIIIVMKRRNADNGRH